MPSPPSPKTRARHGLRIHAAIDAIERRLEHPYSLDELARAARLSRYHALRVFTAGTGERPQAFILRLRLERAALLLTISRRSITEIALDCGFAGSAAFSHAFRAAYGTTPSRWRNRNSWKPGMPPRRSHHPSGGQARDRNPRAAESVGETP